MFPCDFDLASELGLPAIVTNLGFPQSLLSLPSKPRLCNSCFPAFPSFPRPGLCPPPTQPRQTLPTRYPPPEAARVVLFLGKLSFSFASAGTAKSSHFQSSVALSQNSAFPAHARCLDSPTGCLHESETPASSVSLPRRRRRISFSFPCCAPAAPAKGSLFTSSLTSGTRLSVRSATTLGARVSEVVGRKHSVSVTVFSLPRVFLCCAPSFARCSLGSCHVLLWTCFRRAKNG